MHKALPVVFSLNSKLLAEGFGDIKRNFHLEKSVFRI